MKSERLWAFIFALIYFSDWFVIGTFLTIILLIWYHTGVFQPRTFTGIVNFDTWTWGTLAFVLLLPYFIIYLAYLPRAFRLKRRMIYFSDFNHPLYILFALSLIFIYFFVITHAWVVVFHFNNSNLTPGNIFHFILCLLLIIAFILSGVFFVVEFCFYGAFSAYKLLIDGYWYKKLGLEPVTWEEMMAKLEKKPVKSTT